MKIKVCGLKYPGNIGAVSALDPDYMGFIFYEKTARFAGDLPVEALTNLPVSVIKTAVFVNEGTQNINNLIDKYHFDAVQLHGGESADFCNSFRNRVKVVKAFGLNEDFDFSILIDYIDKVDFFLFDTKTPAHGGSGRRFDWSILDKYPLTIPFFLSGGLSSDNIEEVKNISHPQFYGVDLNSGFEIEPGLKAINKLEKAFDIIKQTTNELRS
jgi:phosphoribosylanthranilate isomerase